METLVGTIWTPGQDLQRVYPNCQGAARPAASDTADGVQLTSFETRRVNAWRLRW
jgi:hypothetical protein